MITPQTPDATLSRGRCTQAQANRRRAMPVGLMMLAALALAGCVTQDMPDAAEGATLFAENCAVCHGPTGRGDGALAKGMRPKPADLTLIAQRAGGTFPRAVVLSQIDGYTKRPDQVGMPEFGALLYGDTVPVDVGGAQPSPVPRSLAALLAYLESVQR